MLKKFIFRWLLFSAGIVLYFRIGHYSREGVYQPPELWPKIYQAWPIWVALSGIVALYSLFEKEQSPSQTLEGQVPKARELGYNIVGWSLCFLALGSVGALIIVSIFPLVEYKNVIGLSAFLATIVTIMEAIYFLFRKGGIFSEVVRVLFQKFFGAAVLTFLSSFIWIFDTAILCNSLWIKTDRVENEVVVNGKYNNNLVFSSWKNNSNGYVACISRDGFEKISIGDKCTIITIKGSLGFEYVLEKQCVVKGDNIKV